jgi:hypothetical protein
MSVHKAGHPHVNPMQITGMIGTVEYAIAEDRLDEEGDLWEAREEDPAEGRECSAPFRITPYAGVCLGQGRHGGAAQGGGGTGSRHMTSDNWWRGVADDAVEAEA